MEIRSLYDYFSDIEDHRRASGRRFAMADMLMLLTLSCLNHSVGYQSMSRFFKNNRAALVAALSLKHGVPSYAGMYNFVNSLDISAVVEAINKWLFQFRDLGDSSWYSVDGKSLSGTITDAQGAAQNLVSVVRLVQHNSQAVVQFAYYLTGKKGESETVKLLLRSDEVDIAEKTITADALHCNQAFLQLILQKDAGYVVQVKDNCAALKKK
jgi:hypothetical protein